MELGILLRPVGLMSLILILSYSFNIQVRELYLYDMIEQINIALCPDIYQLIFWNWVRWYKPPSATCWWPWLSFKVTIVWGNRKTLLCILSEIWLSIWMKFSLLPQPVGMLKAHAKFILIKLFKGENSATRFMKHTFSIVMCQNTCEPICFKRDMMQNTTKLYSLIQFEWLWCILKVTGLQTTENVCTYSVVKLHEATQMFMMAELCNGGDCDEVLMYGEIWIIQAFSLLVCCCW